MAFVRVGEFKALPGTSDQLRRVYEAEAIPAIRSAPGNVSAVSMQQREAPETFMAITIWSTEGHAEAYDKSGQALEMVGKIRCAFAGPPTLTTYEAFGLP
jgi:quinol monooxygenase YgiN